jgi:predicted Zn-dependent protease
MDQAGAVNGKHRLDMNEKLLALAEDHDFDALRTTVAAWQKQAEAAQDSADRRLTRQVLQGAAITAGENARALLAQDEYRSAIMWLELSIALRPGRAQTWCDLARAQAVEGNKRDALAALQQAFGAGFSDFARVEQEPAFKSLRKNAAFLELLETMKK